MKNCFSTGNADATGEKTQFKAKNHFLPSEVLFFHCGNSGCFPSGAGLASVPVEQFTPGEVEIQMFKAGETARFPSEKGFRQRFFTLSACRAGCQRLRWRN
ncbi:MAG: hypothetical protein KJ852_06810 [Gammaproteobacteria bacterium]|nr:hypothetical protein [Gammaproteobacteria bacterium]MBU0786274.1 hypothetical protein [Gammaproteobacteria bacterium]MBU0814506.1 hypothetical protein [Gammaproteobacteria bacterium]MBU1786651.1 hypothetical protein [Gammaproteobacteria bacterium]